MNKLKFNLMGILLLTGAIAASGQEAEGAEQSASSPLSFSIQEAMQYALEKNLNAENARLDVESADKRVWEAAAAGLPQGSASAVYNNNLSLATTLIPDFFGNPDDKIEVQFGTKHFANAGVSMNQLIFSGQYIIGLQTAKLFKEFTLKNKNLTDQQVKEAVKQSYFLVLLSENTLQSIQGNLENMRAINEETKAMYKAGFLEETDADQMDLTLTDLENAAASMERQYVASRQILKYQMGIPLKEEITLKDSLSQLVRDLNFQEILTRQMALEENINYKILSDQERLALMDMKLKKTEYMPTLSAFISADFTAQRDEFNLFSTDEDWFAASAFGLSLNIPLFSSGMRMAGVAQKRIAYEQARNTKEFAAEGLRVEYTQAQYDFTNAREQYERELKSLALSKKLIQTTQKKYSEGFASSLELTQVNDQYLQTLSSYTGAIVDLLNAKIRIDVILNTL